MPRNVREARSMSIEHELNKGNHPHPNDLADLLASGAPISPRVQNYIDKLKAGNIKRKRGRPSMALADRAKRGLREAKVQAQTIFNEQDGVWGARKKAIEETAQQENLEEVTLGKQFYRHRARRKP